MSERKMYIALIYININKELFLMFYSILDNSSFQFT